MVTDNTAHFVVGWITASVFTTVLITSGMDPVQAAVGALFGGVATITIDHIWGFD
jgi:hypothetical protein